MEPLRKRSRFSHVTRKDTLDPDFNLRESRARNDLRLKSTFEAIFRKYEHDFTGIGDEIDLQTGEIVVNNGHIMDMRSEHDIGDRKTGPSDDLRVSTTAIAEQVRPRDTSSLLSDDFERLSNCGHKDVKVCADIGVPSDDNDVDSLLGSEQDTNVTTEQDPQMKDMSGIGEGVTDGKAWNDSGPSRGGPSRGGPSRGGPSRGGPSRGGPSRGLPSQQAILSQFGPVLGLQIANLVSNVGNTNYAPVEEAWRVPDLPTAPPAQRAILNSLVNMRQERSVSPLNQTSIWAPPRSTIRPNKGGFVDVGKRIPNCNSPLTTRPRAPVTDNTQMDSRSCNHDGVVFGDGSHRPSSKRKLHESPLRHLPSPQENGPDFCTIEQSNTFTNHEIQPQPVNRKASYTTPKSSPLNNSKPLQNSQVSPLKRKRLQQSKHTAATLSDGGQSLKKQDITPGQLTTQHPRAEAQEFVSPRSNRSPLYERKRLTYCARWTLPEEALLLHLKENTDLEYTQLVEYFPGRTKANIKAHYLLMAPRTKLKPGNSKLPPRPHYTPQEDELLVELRSNKGLPWKDIMTSFPTRTMNSLSLRYCRILQGTPHSTKPMTSEELTSATSEDLLHIDSVETSLGVTPSEQKVFEGFANTDSLDGEHLTQSSLRHTEAAGLRASCEATNKAQPLLPSRRIEKTPLEDQTPKLDLLSNAAFKVVIETSTSKQRQSIAHGEGVITAMATPDSNDRFQCQSEDISAEPASPLKGDLSGRSKSSHKKTSQSRTSKFTPTASMKQKVTKPSNSQGSGTKASPKALTPRSKAALVSLLGDVTDDEDELSKPATVLGGSKDRPLTTPNRTLGQGCMGSKSCDRKFCFKCM